MAPTPTPVTQMLRQQSQLQLQQPPLILRTTKPDGGVVLLRASALESETREVYVGGLPHRCAEAEVWAWAAAFGPVEAVRFGRKSCAVAFVRMASVEASGRAARGLHGLLVRGGRAVLRAGPARPRDMLADEVPGSAGDACAAASLAQVPPPISPSGVPRRGLGTSRRRGSRCGSRCGSASSASVSSSSDGRPRAAKRRRARGPIGVYVCDLPAGADRVWLEGLVASCGDARGSRLLKGGAAGVVRFRRAAEASRAVARLNGLEADAGRGASVLRARLSGGSGGGGDGGGGGGGGGGGDDE